MLAEAVQSDVDAKQSLSSSWMNTNRIFYWVWAFQSVTMITRVPDSLISGGEGS
jgi:hypothetical protein